MNIFDAIRQPHVWMSTTMCHGVWSGIVEDNNDPEKCGRVRIRVHQVHGDAPTENLIWSHALVPLAGRPTNGDADNAGHFYVPEIGTHCWVTFILGDYRYPVYLGQQFGKPDAVADVPKAFLTNYPNRRGYVDPAGVAVIADDTTKEWFVEDATTGQRIKIKFSNPSDSDNPNEILLETDDTQIRISAGGKLIISAFDDSKADFTHSMTVTTGDNFEVVSNESIKVTARDKIDVEAEGEFHLLSKRDNITVESRDNDVIVKGRNIRVQGRDTVKIEAKHIEIEADINLKLNGKRVDIG